MSDLAELAACGYVVTDLDGTIIQANAVFARLTGRPGARLVGQRFLDLLGPGGRIFHETHLSPVLHAEGQVQEIALDLVRPDGTRLPALLNAVLDRSGGGTIAMAVFDATARRSYEHELLLAMRRAEASDADPAGPAEHPRARRRHRLPAGRRRHRGRWGLLRRLRVEARRVDRRRR